MVFEDGYNFSGGCGEFDFEEGADDSIVCFNVLFE